MPEVPFPSWLKPANEAQYYGQGYEMGAQIAQANARLQQAALASQQQHQEAAQRLALSKQQADQEHQLEAQRLAISKAYQDQQISLRKQEVQQQATRLQMETKEAAARYEIGERIKADPEHAADIFMQYGPAANIPGTALAIALRQQAMRNQSRIPEEVMVGDEPFYKIPTETGYRWQAKHEQLDPLTRMERQQQFSLWKSEHEKLMAEQDKDTIGAANASAEDPSKLNAFNKAARDKYLARQKQIDSLGKKLRALTGETDEQPEKPTADKVQKWVRDPSGKLVPAGAAPSPAAAPAAPQAQAAPGPGPVYGPEDALSHQIATVSNQIAQAWMSSPQKIPKNIPKWLKPLTDMLAITGDKTQYLQPTDHEEDQY